MSTFKRHAAVLGLAGSLLAVSCQQSNVGSRTYPDAVVALHQVDPAYRPYFAAQNGSNYSLADQRAAFVKAAQTAKGPMPSYEVRSSGTHVHRKAKVAPKPAVRKGKTAKPTGKKPVAKKPVAKKPAAKKPAVKKTAPAKKTKAPAKKKR